MKVGVGASGQVDSDIARRGLTRQSSSTALLNLSGISERANNTDPMNSSRVNALRATVNTEAVSRLLLSSKETLEKRGIIESAFRVERVCRDSTVDVSDTTSFLVMPSENKRDKYVKRISYARDNGVRIEIFSPDIKKIKNMKLNPRLIIHGIPAEMSAKEIEDELLVLYIFSPKQDMHITSCILEVIPAVRRTLLGCEQIYLRYSACSFSDHIRIVQCYRCLSFGHIAKDCKGKLSYRHCVGAHGMKNCSNKDQSPKCLNYKRHHVSHGDLAYSTMDAAKCSVLGRKVKDKIANTSYE
ncbi:hypothetical protein ACFW04_014700 [Cataglyphis niger]